MLNRLRAFRERRGLTEAELADRLDVSRQTIVSIEKGKYDPSLPLAQAIARLFRVAVEDVFPHLDEQPVLTTATFVMTDISGSTALVRQLGEHYVNVLRRHREILVDVFTSHGGRVVDDTGDACFTAFERADAAIRASLAAQRAIAAEAWPDGVDVAIRIGVHTGDAYAVGNRFVGMAVHETARVCESADGGQILLSETTTAADTSGHERVSAPYELEGVGRRRLYVVGEQ